MKKSNLAKQLSVKTNMTKKRANEVVQTIFDSLTRSLKENDRIEIRGFGSFTIKDYRPYTGRNPKTGQNIQVPAKKLPFFKVGKDLKERLNKKKS